MRKIAHISLILFLMFAVTGVTVQTHYCGGDARYSTIALDADRSSCCGDTMPPCASCMDEINYNVLTTATTVSSSTLHTPDIYKLSDMILVGSHDMHTPRKTNVTDDREDMPRVTFITRSSTIPLLVSSFLI